MFKAMCVSVRYFKTLTAAAETNVSLFLYSEPSNHITLIHDIHTHYYIYREELININTPTFSSALTDVSGVENTSRTCLMGCLFLLRSVCV